MSGAGVKGGAYALTGLLGLVVLACLGAELFTITAPILKNYNEGWNAYRIAAAMHDPTTLYPPRASLMTNNYPPLSFYMVGAVARWTGDAIIAGRMVSFVSTLGIGLCLFLAAVAMGCRRGIAAMAALLFLAAPWVIVRFSATNDPQLLGNFLDAVGLVVILAAPRDAWHIVMSALFLTLAEFVKPLFITLPLALLAWLFVYERRSAILLAGFGLLFAALGYVLTALFFHVELFGYLFSPRLFLWSRLTGQPGQWLLVEALPFLASLALFRQRDGFAFFTAFYAALAFALAVIFSGGDGVSASQMMEPAMAVALGAALYLQRAGEAPWRFAGLGLIAAFQAVMLGLSFLGLWASRPSLPELMGSRYATRFDIAALARQRDPVMCETLALCYWAGRTPQVDAFGFNQAIRRGIRPTRDLTRLLDVQAFSMIQLQPVSIFNSPSPLWPAIVRNYYLEHQDRNGLFLIPRDEPLSQGMDIYRH
ncbi:MAG TPA: hypothetical protein VNW15_08970 [Rhizomicrobium sp.]|nr:hypothetical protein [Rhizomicrobium sp.]